MGAAGAAMISLFTVGWTVSTKSSIFFLIGPPVNIDVTIAKKITLPPCYRSVSALLVSKKRPSTRKNLWRSQALAIDTFSFATATPTHVLHHVSP